MKLVVDMNLSPQWAPFLIRHGHDCVHWQDVGDPEALDPEVMQWALANDRIVLTHDLDFGRILALTHANGPSVIQLRCNDTLPAVVGGMVIDVLRDHEQELIDGALVVIDVVRSRVRLLPI